MPKQRPQRCNARRRRSDAALYRADREGWLMEFLRSSSWCRNWPVSGRKRCRLHGGFSTGPRSPEGKARTVAAMVDGRRRLLEKLKGRREAGALGPQGTPGSLTRAWGPEFLKLGFCAGRQGCRRGDECRSAGHKGHNAKLSLGLYRQCNNEAGPLRQPANAFTPQTGDDDTESSSILHGSKVQADVSSRP